MRKPLLFAVLLLLTVSVKAQFVSLNDKEVQNLKDLIAKDPEVSQLYSTYQVGADEARNVRPTPIDVIRTEGLLSGDPKKVATALAVKDMHRMYCLALAFRIEGEKNYLSNLGTYFTSWARVNTSHGDPIDDTNLEEAIEAYDLVKKQLRPNDNEQVIKWFKQTADAEIAAHKSSLTAGSSYNNWNSHRLKIVGMIAYAIDDAGYKQYVADDLKTQMEKNLFADGSGADFKQRDALHYHVYDLEPLLRLAIVLKRATGVDAYSAVSSTGSSIKKSVEWVVPYITGQKTHAEFVNSTVKFDQDRANNGEAEYKAGALWNPKNGLRTLALAAYFDPQYNDIIKKVTGAPKNYSYWQLVINKVTL